MSNEDPKAVNRKEKKPLGINKKLLMLFLVCVAVNIVTTRYLLDRQKQQVQAQIDQRIPKIMTVNIEKTVSTLLAAGEEPLEVLRYVETLTQMLIAEGYLVINESALATTNPQYAMRPISKENLYRAANTLGIKADTASLQKLEEQYEKKKKETDQLLNQ